jgi:hypothetical protein
MQADPATSLLTDGAGTEEPVFLPPDVLPKLPVDDLLPDTFVEIGVRHGQGGIHDGSC